MLCIFFFFQAEDGIRYLVRSRGLGDVYKRQKLFLEVAGIANRPAFYLGLLLIIVGVQLFIAGFLGELVSRNAPDKNVYQVEKLI